MTLAWCARLLFIARIAPPLSLRVKQILLVLARCFFSFVIMQRPSPFIPARGIFSFVITRSDSDEVISALVLLFCPGYGNRGGLSNYETAALALLARGDKWKQRGLAVISGSSEISR